MGAYAEGYTDVVLEGLAKAAKRRNVNLILLEDQFGQGMLQSLLQPFLREHHPCTIEPVRSNVQKERRIINALEPVMNQHRLVINRSVIEQDSRGRDDESVETSLAYQLFHQLTHITVEPKCLQHDDRLDALAGAIQYWNESLAIDEDRVIKERQAELWDLELEAYMGNLEGALDAKVLGIPLDQLGRSDAEEWINLQVDKPRAYVVRLPGSFLGEWGTLNANAFQTVVVATSPENAFEIASVTDTWQQLPFPVETCQVFPKDVP